MFAYIWFIQNTYSSICSKYSITSVKIEAVVRKTNISHMITQQMVAMKTKLLKKIIFAS